MHDAWAEQLAKLLRQNEQLGVDAATLNELTQQITDLPQAKRGATEIEKVAIPPVVQNRRNTAQRTPRKRKEPAPTEHAEQVSLFQRIKPLWDRYPELELLYAIPNGAKLPYGVNANGQRYSKQASILLAEGLKSGVPDMCLPVARNGYHGMYIELKRADHSNGPSDLQVVWMKRLQAEGYHVVLAYGGDEAFDALIQYMETGV